MGHCEANSRHDQKGKADALTTQSPFRMTNRRMILARPLFQEGYNINSIPIPGLSAAIQETT